MLKVPVRIQGVEYAAQVSSYGENFSGPGPEPLSVPGPGQLLLHMAPGVTKASSRLGA